MEKLLVKGAAGSRHPAASVHTPVGIDEQLLEGLQDRDTAVRQDHKLRPHGGALAHLGALLPADPEVAPGQEADHSSPGAGADPALSLQLDHDGVDPGEAGPTLGPLGQGLGVLVPRDLDAHGVPLHLVEVGVAAGDGVEELPLQEPEVVRGTSAGLRTQTHIGC